MSFGNSALGTRLIYSGSRAFYSTDPGLYSYRFDGSDQMGSASVSPSGKKSSAGQTEYYSIQRFIKSCPVALKRPRACDTRKA